MLDSCLSEQTPETKIGLSLLAAGFITSGALALCWVTGSDPWGKLFLLLLCTEVGIALGLVKWCCAQLLFMLCTRVFTGLLSAITSLSLHNQAAIVFLLPADLAVSAEQTSRVLQGRIGSFTLLHEPSSSLNA